MDPAFARRRLRDRLRRLREAAGFTQRQVAEAMEWSPSKVIRMESGNVGVSVTDLRVLLPHYGVEDADEVNQLISMARTAKSKPWWERYKSSVPAPAFFTYLAYEGNASVIRLFSPFRIPGLLQTEEYMREIFHSSGASEEAVDSRVELRLERQERLLQPSGPNLNFILDESVLRRPVRTKGTMRRQLTHLLESFEQPNITIRVMKYSDGIYPKCFAPYVILEFENTEEDLVLYLEENRTVKEGASDGPDEYSPADYLEVFFSLEQIASTDRTCDLLQEALRDFE
ncbi:helix-turn-helix domain-containing protein [Streptomyces sp. NPDC051554]|uniref:helix-turn-helix domain-containing protein n=1 Tax=Streptomyces sp. NPDC051554 TaxID=3365656 RepID=UPI0037A1A20D